MSEKASVWKIENAEILPAEKKPTKSTDVVVSFSGKISKNGETQKQKVLKVTLAQRDSGVTVHFDPATKVATVTRIEKRAGRPNKKGIESEKAIDALKALGFNVK